MGNHESAQLISLCAPDLCVEVRKHQKREKESNAGVSMAFELLTYRICNSALTILSTWEKGLGKITIYLNMGGPQGSTF